MSMSIVFLVAHLSDVSDIYKHTHCEWTWIFLALYQHYLPVKSSTKLVCQQIVPSNGEIKNAACRCFLMVRHSLSIMWSREEAKILKGL